MISYIIPVFNSQETIEEVVYRTVDLCVKNSYDYEIILVDDGSIDSSWDKISGLADGNARIIGIQHAKNFGQHNALMTGLKACNGGYIIALDDDMQILPEDSVLLINKLDAGHDVVYSHYAVKKHSFLRNLG